MKFLETKLKGAFIIRPEKIEDQRGFFARVWCKKEFLKYSIDINFVQSNISFNKKTGTLRGMHFQRAPFEESKLIRCTKGAIFDVILDLRKESNTYKNWVSINLTAENHKMIYIPKGFAHGFQTLRDETEVAYLHSEYYVPDATSGVAWDDPAFRIIWPEISTRIISDKDRNWPFFRD